MTIVNHYILFIQKLYIYYLFEFISKMESEKNQNNDQNDGKFLNKIGNKLVEETQTAESAANLNKVLYKIIKGTRRIK